MELSFSASIPRLTEDLQAKAGRHRTLLMLDALPALGQLDFFESALASGADMLIPSMTIASTPQGSDGVLASAST